MRDTATRIAAAAGDLGAEWALLSAPESVTYVTGHAVPIETGPSPFSGGPTLAVVGRDGRAALVAPSHEASPGEDRFLYSGFALANLPLAANLLRALNEAIDAIGAHGPVAIESGSLPLLIAEAARARATSLIDGTQAFRQARVIKTEREIQLLRSAAQAASVAQQAVPAAARADITELAAFGEVRAAAEQHIGERLPFAGDFVAGRARTAATGGWPTSRKIRQGDAVMADLAPRVDGYWADSCSTFTLSARADTAWLRLWHTVHDALTALSERVVPGMPMSEIDKIARTPLMAAGYQFPHHTGHNIGTAVHEHPRIIPTEEATLQPGMVILLEPGAYEPAVGGVRLEHMFLVTQRRLEQLTHFPLRPTL